MKSKQNFVYLGAAVIVAAGLAFFVYKFFTSSKGNVQPAQNGSNNSAGFGSGQRAGRGNFSPPTAGTITSISGQTLVMTLSDNSTKNIDCTNVSRISQNVNGTTSQLQLSDLKVGDKINVMGTDSNGTIAARMIFIGDMPARNRGGYSQGGANTQSTPDTQGAQSTYN